MDHTSPVPVSGKPEIVLRLLFDFMVPIVIAVIVGISASYLTTRVQVAIQQRDIEYNQQRIENTQKNFDKLSTQMTEFMVAARKEWRDAAEERSEISKQFAVIQYRLDRLEK